MNDDFLAQIQKAEASAEQMIQQAHEKAQKEIRDEEKRLGDKRNENLEQSRENAKKVLSEKQKEMRAQYDKLVKDGQKSAQVLEKEAEERIEKMLPTAFSYLLNELV